jgi:hypothetical protein
LSTNTLTEDTTKDTKSYTDIAIETIATTAATATAWANHVNVIAATIVNQMTATTNGRDEDEINETIATTEGRANKMIAKIIDPAESLLQDKAIILAL